MTSISTTETQAYGIAIKTLKERCQHLQEKLVTIENENHKLRTQGAQSDKTFRSREVSSLEEELALVSQENSQLIHQLQLVSSENKTLWTQLSKLTAVNQSLGCKLSMISDTLSQHENLHNTEGLSDHAGEVTHKQGMEDISLKLLQGILLEKTELESQYAQMVDLQNESQLDLLNIQDLAFPQLEQNVINEGLTKHMGNLNNMKDKLLSQQKCLNKSLLILRNLKSLHMSTQSMVHCKTPVAVDVNNKFYLGETASNVQLSNIPKLNAGNVEAMEVKSQENICPMCSASLSGPFEQFQHHVTSHFADEEEQDLSNQFELLS